MADEPDRSETSRDSYFQRGTQAYKFRKIPLAIDCFSSVIKLCPCLSGRPGEPLCTCKNWSWDDQDDIDALAREVSRECTCPGENRIPRCDNSDHLKAYDCRAACHEANRHHDSAMRDAQNALTACPEYLSAFLRLAKVLRMQSRFIAAWKAYSVGILVARQRLLVEDPRFEQMLSLRQIFHDRLFRRDILQLPREIVIMIFSYFDATQLCILRSVSRGWRDFLHSSPELWRKINYPKKAPPSARAIDFLLRRAGHALSEVSIQEIDKFRFSPGRFRAMFGGYKSLKRLNLSRINRDVINNDSRFPLHLEQLTHLTFSVVLTEPGWKLLASFMGAAPNLEYLNVHMNLATTSETIFPLTPKLRWLKLTIRSDMQVTRNGIISLAQATPNLEQMELRSTINTRNRHTELLTPPNVVHEHPNLWRNLRCLVSPAFLTIEKLLLPDADTLQPILPVEDFRCLVCQGLDRFEQFLPVLTRIDRSYFATEVVVNPPRALDRIQIFNVDHYFGFPHLNTQSALPPHLIALESMINNDIRTAVAQGQLREFQLTIPVFEENKGYLDRLGWLRSQRGIKVLTLVFSSRYFGSPDRYSISSRDVEGIAKLIASLRDLEIIDLRASELPQELVGMFIEKLLSKSIARIKAIHQDCVWGKTLDHLRAFAMGSFGTEMKWGPRVMEFPIILED